MNFVRNPEVKRSIIIYFLFSILFCVLGYFISKKTFFFTFIICLFFVIYHFLITYKRYKAIIGIADEIDGILQNSTTFNLEQYAEGELGVLQSEVYKITVMLREQAEILKKDKIYLADSIADISHQIRTPLTSINLITSFLSEEKIDDDKRIRYTKELYSLLSRIDWLINSLLKISKIDAGTVKFQREPVLVSDIIKKSYDTIAIAMDLRNQKLVVNSNGDEKFVGDIGWTVEAIENIMKNCMEHTPSGGTLTVSVEETAIYTQIIISDTGCGIAKDDLPNIFKRFYKGKNSSNSSVGIGLALSKMIIIEQNGVIKAKNNNDVGSSFIIKFYKTTV